MKVLSAGKGKLRSAGAPLQSGCNLMPTRALLSGSAPPGPQRRRRFWGRSGGLVPGPWLEAFFGIFSHPHQSRGGRGILLLAFPLLAGDSRLSSVLLSSWFSVHIPTPALDASTMLLDVLRARGRAWAQACSEPRARTVELLGFPSPRAASLGYTCGQKRLWEEVSVCRGRSDSGQIRQDPRMKQWLPYSPHSSLQGCPACCLLVS